MDAEGMEASGCECDLDDAEGPSFLNTRLPRARKEHRCCECRRAIKIGEVHEYIVGKWDDRLGFYRTCVTCSRIRRDYGGCAGLGHLRQEIRVVLGFDYF